MYFHGHSQIRKYCYLFHNALLHIPMHTCTCSRYSPPHILRHFDTDCWRILEYLQSKSANPMQTCSCQMAPLHFRNEYLWNRSIFTMLTGSVYHVLESLYKLVQKGLIFCFRKPSLMLIYNNEIQAQRYRRCECVGFLCLYVSNY